MTSLPRQVLTLALVLTGAPAGCSRTPVESKGSPDAKDRPGASAIGMMRTSPPDGPSATGSPTGVTAPPDPFAPPADMAAPPADATKTATTLAWKMLAKGDSELHPGPRDRVTVSYTGWTRDGRMFDSSLKKGMPASFWMSNLIPGWVQGLQLMVKGDKRRFWIPAYLAYGDQPADPRSPAGPLVFDIELVDFTPWPEEPKGPPPGVAAIPRDARRTASGLAYKVLKRGSGKAHPAADGTVEIHYNGWLSDGRLFDTSMKRGQPATYALTAVNKGWNEALRLMVVGDKWRLWVPGRLIYGDRPGPLDKSSRLFVFEIELVSIK